jgi:eukaryotic-like serine/threonine-protein kinase
MSQPAFSYRFGTAEFDEARFELRVAGLPVDVEHRALQVLAHLLRHAGEVVTKEELLRDVWAGRITVDKVLPNAINKVRRALGPTNADCISTQARVGYRLDGPVSRMAVGRQAPSPLALAAGQSVPGRANFVLQRLLSRTSGSEVWLAMQAKTQEVRVYKFALATDGLRALKREITLVRVMQESLPDLSHLAEVIDWNFETAPYFIECKDGGEPLHAWAAQHLSALDRPARIALFLQVADAVADAHSVGVLHKDLKPANVLVAGDAQQPHVRLTDFGCGHLLEPDRLEMLGITRLGLTVDANDPLSSTAGTPIYLAPELFADQAPTIQSDVYALGVLLYQLLSDRIGQPMASGWEADINDALLAEDLRLATEGEPSRRLQSVAALSDRLRQLDMRRADALQRKRDAEQVRLDRQAFERTKAQRPYVHALVAVLSVGVLVTGWLLHQAVDARNQALASKNQAVEAGNRATVELARATALARFLNEDLISRSNPLVLAKGPDATLREVLLSARGSVAERFAAQSDTQAVVRSSLASLLASIDLMPDAEAEAREAIALFERAAGGDAVAPGATGSGIAEFQARSVLVRALEKSGKRDEANEQLQTLERIVASTQLPGVATQSGGTANQLGGAATQLAIARGGVHTLRNEFSQAVVALRQAKDGLQAHEPSNISARHAVQLDLIFSLQMAGQPEEARREGLALIQEAQAQRQPNALLVALAQLSMARAQGENHAEAERLLLQAQPVIAAQLGESHSRYLTLLNELLGAAMRRGDWAKALPYAEQVHQRVLTKLGDKHPVTYVTLTNWARVMSEAGQPAQALPKVQRAQQQLQALLGPKAAQFQDATTVLVQVTLQLGLAEQALGHVAQLNAEVLEASRAIGVWPHVIDAMRGIALQQRGDRAAARKLLDEALEALKEEEALDKPSQVYVMAKQARAKVR